MPESAVGVDWPRAMMRIEVSRTRETLRMTEGAGRQASSSRATTLSRFVPVRVLFRVSVARLASNDSGRARGCVTEDRAHLIEQLPARLAGVIARKLRGELDHRKRI